MKIGLTHTGNSEKHQYYIDWLKGNDGTIDIVDLSAENNNLDKVKECDALVLSGGVDIHPRYYGNSKTDYAEAPEKFKEQRDEFEIAAYQSAQENNLPVLGICRGLQLINVIHNGTLIQNLDTGMLSKHIGNPDKSHTITISQQTILHDIIGEDSTSINSAHHQAIDRLGEGLRVNAKSGEGIPEGIERKDPNGKPFLLAIQWHPERMFRFNLENSPASKAIRQRFVEEIKKSIAAKK